MHRHVHSTAFLALLGLGAVLPARAEGWTELVLKDGRRFQAVRYLSQNHSYITVRHKGGLAQIRKIDLPPSLQSLYPSDPVGAAEVSSVREKMVTEMMNQAELSRARAMIEYEQRRSAERLSLALAERERQSRESELQAAREAGSLQGSLSIVHSAFNPRSVVIGIKNVGEKQEDLDWHRVEAITRGNETYSPNAAMPRDGRSLDWSVAPGATRMFELGFGLYQPNPDNPLVSVRWR